MNGGIVRWIVFCHVPNVHDKMADGKTAYETRFGAQVDGTLIQLGDPRSSSKTRKVRGSFSAVHFLR